MGQCSSRDRLCNLIITKPDNILPNLITVPDNNTTILDFMRKLNTDKKYVFKYK